MGIKNLHTFLRKSVPGVYEEIHFSEYAFRTIAVDTAIYLCKFKTSWGSEWLNGFVQLCTMLRTHGIHPVFVFDTVFPPEKDEEKKRRADARRQQRHRVEELGRSWEAYKASHPTVGRDEADRTYCHLDDPGIPIHLYSFLFKTFISTDSHSEEHGHRIAVEDVDAEFVRMENALLVVTAEDYGLIRELLDTLRIPWVMAIGEAEATAAYLCHHGLVDAVLTDDTDALAYGATVFLHRLNLQDHTCMRIRHDRLLDLIEMTPELFLDFCILCGTDYNSNIPGIGIERAYRLLRSYGSIEGVLDHLPPTKKNSMPPLPFHRVREMFRERPPLEAFTPERLVCDFPQWDRVTAFLDRHGCSLQDRTALHEALFTNPLLIFPSDPQPRSAVHAGATGYVARGPSLLRPARSLV